MISLRLLRLKRAGLVRPHRAMLSPSAVRDHSRARSTASGRAAAGRSRLLCDPMRVLGALLSSLITLGLRDAD